MSILIVDDDEEYLGYMCAALTNMGHKPLLSASGYAAIKAIEKEDFALIITDLRIPDMSGMAIMELARKNDPLTVCIAMTAFASVDSAIEALSCGAYDYLPKPAGIDVIQATVRRGLQHHELRKTLIERTAQMEKFKRESREAVELIRRLSQELRSPLEVVYDCSSSLTRDEKKVEPQELLKGIQFIQKNIEKLRNILNGVDPQK